MFCFDIGIYYNKNVNKFKDFIMAKTKVKSRDEKLREQWFKYFKNIEKENDLIRVILEYYYKAISEKVSKSYDDIDWDQTITDEYGEKYRRSDFRNETEDSKEDSQIDPKELSNSELRYYLTVTIDEFRKIKSTIDSTRRNAYIKYLKLLQIARKETKESRPTQKQNNFTSLYLENFKGFAHKEDKKDNTIKIKPITLIYGPNSFGKSSILQSLLLLNQTVNEGGDYRDVCLVPEGEVVNLGTFREFLNKNATNEEVLIEMSLPWNHYIDEDEEESLTDTIDKAIYEENYEKEDVVFMYYHNETSLLKKISFCLHFALKKENKKDKIIMPQIDIFSEQMDYTNPNKPCHKEKELLYTLKRNAQNGEIYECNKGKKKRISFFRVEEVITGNSFEQLENIIKGIVYLSSSRKPAERYYVPGNNTRTYVGKNGKYTSEILYDPDVLDYVNKWLFEIAGYRLSDEKGNDKVKSINLNDDNAKVNNINLLDLGSGIAQVLPIITQAFKSEGEMILIEEPEIHLHPKAQATLGEMFARAAQKRNNTFIIETHSENLMLRLGKMIRTKELSKDDVSIIYVHKDKNGSHCIPLIFDDEGDIENIDVLDSIGGFFDEGFEELFL